MEQKDTESQQELQDPQDTAAFSPDMTERKIVQEEVRCKSVFDALVEVGRRGGKLYRTNGKRADLMRFDLTTHSVFAGSTFIIQRAKVRMPVLETAAVKVSLEGLPWLTQFERDIEPGILFTTHYLSRPNGSEAFAACNFPAANVDDLTDDQVISGVPRTEARIRLEAWMLCAALDGTLERYVTRQPNYRPDSFFWSPATGDEIADKLVVKHDWWRSSRVKPYMLSHIGRPGNRKPVITKDRQVVLRLDAGLTPAEQRTFQMAEELRRTLASLVDETFRLQLRTKRDDCDALLNDANRILRYINRGNPPAKA